MQRRQSFIWSLDYPRDLAVYPKASDGQPLILFRIAFLFDLAPCGVYLAAPVTRSAVRSYRTISPLPRWAGRCIFCGTFRRVAPPSCYEAHCPVEFGLSSTLVAQARDYLAGSDAFILSHPSLLCQAGRLYYRFQKDPAAPDPVHPIPACLSLRQRPKPVWSVRPFPSAWRQAPGQCPGAPS